MNGYFFNSDAQLPPELAFSNIRVFLVPRYVFLIASIVGTLLLACPSWAETGEGRGAHEKATDHYRVIDGKVDKSTMLGWRVFHSACFGCHGIGAAGTDVAPDLTQRVKRLSPAEFAMTVLSRYRILVPYREGLPEDRAELAAIVEEMKKRKRGPHGQLMMPAWESDPRIKPHIMDLYAYLRVRADGALGPGRPEPIEPEQNE